MALQYNWRHCPRRWMCTPKGTAFLWVERGAQAGLTPLVTSHGYGLVVLHIRTVVQAIKWAHLLGVTCMSLSNKHPLLHRLSPS